MQYIYNIHHHMDLLHLSSLLIILSTLLIIVQNHSVLPSNITYKYYVFTQKCYDTLITQSKYFDFDCLKQLIVKCLGYGVVVGASIVKLPQIIKILSKKSTFGVSFEAVLLEEITQLCAVAYNISKNHAFSVYGETLLISSQMIIIHLLFSIFDKQNRLKSLILFPFVIAFFYCSIYPQFLPKFLLQYTMIVQMVLLFGARMMQIIQIHKIKSTGSVSLITFGLSVLGNLARLSTALVQVKGDYLFLLSVVLALLLNMYIVFTFYLFKNNKQKVQKKQ